jgi:hypothetical protein
LGRSQLLESTTSGERLEGEPLRLRLRRCGGRGALKLSRTHPRIGAT